MRFLTEFLNLQNAQNNKNTLTKGISYENKIKNFKFVRPNMEKKY